MEDDNSSHNQPARWAPKCIPVVHHKQLQLRDIVHDELLELVGQVVPGLLVRTVPNVGHQGNSLEFPPDTRVDTLWPAPACLQKQHDQK